MRTSPLTVRLRTLVLAASLALALGVAGVALVVWYGVYNVSAAGQHTVPVYALLDFALKRSISVRAEAIPPPASGLANETRVRAGAAIFRDHCVQCHGAPGVAPEPFAFGLRPAPANLLAAGREWSPAEIHWVIKNGIKMTGMPAWDYRLSKDEIWSVVAFVQAMPRMTVRGYAQLAGSLPARDPYAEATQGSASGKGSVEAGRRAVAQYLCATCHRIPGFVSAKNHVGPPLDGVGRRAYIGGVLANTPENMVRWLKNPQAVDPLSAMPPLGLTDQDARDIAAYLGTLERVEHK